MTARDALAVVFSLSWRTPGELLAGSGVSLWHDLKGFEEALAA
jgi:hypothetical protein